MSFPDYKVMQLYVSFQTFQTFFFFLVPVRVMFGHLETSEWIQIPFGRKICLKWIIFICYILILKS